MGEHEKQKRESQEEPDVVLDIPKLKVEEINLKVDDVKAKLSLSAHLAQFVYIEAGAEVHIETVELEMKGVEAEAQLKVRLEKVQAILKRTMETIDRNPELLKSLRKPVGEGAAQAADGMTNGEE